MTSPHPSKRQYLGPPASTTPQQSITTYFAPTPSLLPADRSSSSTSNTSYISTLNTSHEPSSTLPIPPSHHSSSMVAPPALPAHVQSNLLSVGMRVRKSIPEGYKTGAYNAFTLFSESPVSPCTPVPFRSDVRSSGPWEGGNGNMCDGREKISLGRARSRELTPFCGILKVGGFAVQETELDDCPPLSSQGSTITVDSWVGSFASEKSGGSGNSNKRRWVCDDEEAEAEQDGDIEGEWDKSILGVVGQGHEPNGRTIAVPRKMKGVNGMASGLPNQQVVKILGTMEQEMDPEYDFGEAVFLDHKIMGGEVEMYDA